MFYNVYSFKSYLYDVIIFWKDITEKVRLVVLHGLATIDGLSSIMQLSRKHELVHITAWALINW